MALRRTKEGGRVGKHYLRWLRALRRTQKEARLENTLPKVVDGSKAH
jgi:hypothetical protein